MKEANHFTISIDRDSSIPVYIQLGNQLKEYIRSDQIEIGESLPPENVICQLSGLSRMTVRKTIEELHKQGLVVAERGRGTFVIAKSPQSPVQASVGFVLRPDRFIEDDPFYSQILMGVTEEAHRQNIHLAFIKGENLGSQDRYSERYPFLSQLAGLVIAGQMPNAFLEYIQSIRIPSVFLNYRSKNNHFDSVTYDQYEIGHLLANHLLERNHIRCLYLNGEQANIAYEQRLEGFKKTFLHSPQHHIHVIHEGKDSPSGRAMIHEALSQQWPFTSVVAGNDLIAIGAMYELQDQGYRIPEEISVCGINNIHASEHSRPALTTVHIEKKEMGRRALNVLRQRIQKPQSVHETILLGVKIMERQSTAIAPFNQNIKDEVLIGK